MIPVAPFPKQHAPDPQAQPSWQQLWRDAVRDPRELLDLLGLGQAALNVSDAAATQFPLRVPRGFVAKMRHGDPNDPLLRQVLPLDDELKPMPGFSFDAVGDGAAKAADGVIRKYRGRALLVTTGSCAVHCRYCFRRHYPYGDAHAGNRHWQQAVEHIACDDSIHEVILSGGDPLTLSDDKLCAIIGDINSISHVSRLRIHTRVPVTIPARVTQTLLHALRASRLKTIIVLHINHPREIDDDVRAMCRRLHESGALLLNQSVLLHGINDCEHILAELSDALFAAGILPYYLHQLDRVVGASHFLVDEDTAKALHEKLMARLPGYLVPRLVREDAGAPSKTPI